MGARIACCGGLGERGEFENSTGMLVVLVGQPFLSRSRGAQKEKRRDRWCLSLIFSLLVCGFLCVSGKDLKWHCWREEKEEGREEEEGEGDGKGSNDVSHVREGRHTRHTRRKRRAKEEDQRKREKSPYASAGIYCLSVVLPLCFRGLAPL